MMSILALARTLTINKDGNSNATHALFPQSNFQHDELKVDDYGNYER
jgi:hypothetical protein